MSGDTYLMMMGNIALSVRYQYAKKVFYTYPKRFEKRKSSKDELECLKLERIRLFSEW